MMGILTAHSTAVVLGIVVGLGWAWKAKRG